MLKLIAVIFWIIGVTIAIANIDDVEVSRDGDSYFLSIYAGDKQTPELKPKLAAKALSICPNGYIIISESLGPFDDKNKAMPYYLWEIQCN